MSTELIEQVESLAKASFTDAFIKNEIHIEDLLNSLRVNVNRLNLYDNGEILGLNIELCETNKAALSNIIKDFESYNAFNELQFFTCGKCDLVGILSYLNSVHNVRIVYDKEDSCFYQN